MNVLNNQRWKAAFSVVLVLMANVAAITFDMNENVATGDRAIAHFALSIQLFGIVVGSILISAILYKTSLHTLVGIGLASIIPCCVFLLAAELSVMDFAFPPNANHWRAPEINGAVLWLASYTAGLTTFLMLFLGDVLALLFTLGRHLTGHSSSSGITVNK